MSRYLPHMVLGFALLFALSPLASDGFNGFTPDQFPVVQDHWPVEPAGWAFSIWGVIYGWLILGSVWGLLRTPDAPGWQAMRGPLALSLFVGIFWIAVANVSPPLATVMILIMAAGAIAAFLRAGAGQPLLLAGPVGLYAGWLTAASGVAVSVSVMLSGYGLASAQVAALALMALVLVVALSVQARRPARWSYPLAVCWALFGIAMDNRGEGNWPVITLACLGIAALVVQYVLRGRVSA